MPHAIWNGSISFGLVTIPVSLMPAEDRSAQLSFRLLDGRDLSPVRQKRVNESTGEEVAWDEIVKGYQLPDNRWVVLAEEDFRAANVEATQTIDILAAVCADEIDATYYATPYHLVPAKNGRKAYALLREALASAERVALAKIVIRTRQHLAAIVPQGELLLLEILRYPYELRPAEGLDVPSADLAAVGATEAELAMATELVKTISTSFEPGADVYRDTYRDDLLALIEAKAEGGETVAPQPPAAAEPAEVVDIMVLLKRSLDQAKQVGA
jgi:DNA end-binding protein Ku